MIDLHVHLLPGVDDGPETVVEAVSMARAALEDGCHTLVATPHQRHTRWPNLELPRLAALVARVRQAVGPTPAIHLGAEVRDGSGVLEDLERGELLSLAGTRYVLFECERRLPNPQLVDLVHEMVLLGRVPLLAHVERIPWLAGDPQLVAEVVAAGALTQVTAGSLLGAFGRFAESAAWRLLDQGLVHVLASDSHGIEYRPPGLAVGRRRVERRYGPAVGALLTEHNPAAILADQPLEMAPIATSP